MKAPHVVLYPFLAAAYPVLALAAKNPGDVPGLWVLRWPLCISLLFSLCAWLLIGLFTRNRDRQALLTLMFVTLFSSYGYVIIGMRDLPQMAPYAQSLLPFLFIVCYLAGITYVVLRLVRNLRGLSRFLSILISILVGWNSIELLRHTLHWNGLPAQPSERSETQISTLTQSGSGPDIYLIVLDKYTGSRSLKSNFGFDNTDFEAYLRSRGFVLPPAAQANYIYTILSLAALLNYRYLDELDGRVEAQGRNKNYLKHIIEDNAVWRFLKPRGYRFIFFPTAFPFTATNRFADLQLPDPRQIPSEFEIVWRWTTLVDPVLTWICQRVNCAGAARPFTNEPRLLEWKFDQLSRLPRLATKARPLFVFAHLTIPHEPYVFEADCKTRPPLWPSYSVVHDDEKQAYIAQITCLNRRLRGLVEHLLHDSPTPPIILLQSDHGHGRIPLHIPELDAVTPDRVAERADIFAAYYLPSANRNAVYDSITPVNVFRTVFRQYFHTDLAPLPDMTYWSPWTNIFKFTGVRHGYRLQE